MTTVIRGARLFDGTGSVPIVNAIVAVEQDEITYAGPADGFHEPLENASVVDAEGMTVLPGLIDLHVHLISYRRPVEYYLERTVSASILRATVSCEKALRHGITTVRDCGARHDGIFALRDSINAGETKGPRIFAAGKAICMTGSRAWEVQYREADGPDECRKATREQLRPAGDVFPRGSAADFIKIMATDGTYYRTRTQFTVEEMAAIVDEARRKERRTCAHVGGAAGALNCVRAGVDCIEHGNVLDHEAIEAMTKAGTYLVPTLVVYWEPAVLGTAAGFSDYEIGYCKLAYEPHKRSFQMALEAGIKIGAGSDTVPPHEIGKTLHKELELMVEYGMTPAESLHAATGAAAEILGEHRLGTLRVGKLADLLIVKGDPLTDISATRNISMVMKAGQIVVDHRSP